MDDGGERRVCVDGKQRLTSIFRYVETVVGSRMLLTEAGTCMKIYRGTGMKYSCVLMVELDANSVIYNRYLVLAWLREQHRHQNQILIFSPCDQELEILSLFSLV